MSIKNIDKLTLKLKNISKIDATKFMEKATNLIRTRAIENITKNGSVQTGALRSSINYDVQYKKGEVIGVVFSNLEYAPYVEFGTGPVGQQSHRGVSPKVSIRYSPTGWRYYDEKLGRWFYTKGQKAKPFLYPALRRSKKEIREQMAKEFNQKAKQEAKK